MIWEFPFDRFHLFFLQRGILNTTFKLVAKLQTNWFNSNHKTSIYQVAKTIALQVELDYVLTFLCPLRFWEGKLSLWYIILSTCQQFCSVPVWEFRGCNPKRFHSVLRYAFQQHKTWSKTYAAEKAQCLAYLQDVKVYGLSLLFIDEYLFRKGFQQYRQTDDLTALA